MQQLLKFGLIFIIATSGLIFTACDGEDGDPGAAGSKGEKGDKGDTGDQGAGFDEATQYGHIVVRYTGTRSDGLEFDETVDYRFAPLGPNDEDDESDLFNNSGTISEDNVRAFRVGRFLGSVDDSNDQSGVTVGLIHSTEGEGEQFSMFDLLLEAALTTDDYKYFSIRQNIAEFVSSEDISEYSYTPTTGSLKVKIDTTLPGENNGTGHELTLSITVDATVFENLQGNVE
jgi:hypothetical protein